MMASQFKQHWNPGPTLETDNFNVLVLVGVPYHAEGLLMFVPNVNSKIARGGHDASGGGAIQNTKVGGRKNSYFAKPTRCLSDRPEALDEFAGRQREDWYKH